LSRRRARWGRSSASRNDGHVDTQILGTWLIFTQATVVNERSGSLNLSDRVKKYPLGKTHSTVTKYGKPIEGFLLMLTRSDNRSLCLDPKRAFRYFCFSLKPLRHHPDPELRAESPILTQRKNVSSVHKPAFCVEQNNHIN
jgi:hypothetical protein